MLQQAIAHSTPTAKKQVFVSYSHKDANAKRILMLALRELEHEGHISAWHDTKLLAGQAFDKEILKFLQRLMTLLPVRSTCCS
jgi:hypothetical protein